MAERETTVGSLFGNLANLPAGIADARILRPGGGLHLFTERAPQLRACGTGWERITLIVDSGASETVVPPSVCRAAECRHSSKVGIEYECADGGVVKNLGEKVCDMRTGEDDPSGMAMAFQVVDVSKALLSVHRVCEQGHDVVFSKLKGDYILINGDVENRIPLRAIGGTFELDVASTWNS